MLFYASSLGPHAKLTCGLRIMAKNGFTSISPRIRNKPQHFDGSSYKKVPCFFKCKQPAKVSKNFLLVILHASLRTV